MPPAQLFLPFTEAGTIIRRMARRCGFTSAPPISPPIPADAQSWKHGIQVKVVRPSRARRYLLRLQPDGSARLVIPRRGSRAEAFRFLERNESWLLQRFRQWQSSRHVWSDGTSFLFRGEPVVLQIEDRGGEAHLRFADQIIETPPQADYRDLVHARLRQIAERKLPVRTRELARIHGIAIGRVTVRAQKTRWGSCSARGTISLNWRVIQAPASVQDYLIIHELMHRREMNHSARYWKLVAAAFPDYRAAEGWLKRQRLDAMD
jgi:predicted metal-dependent hydrolase